MSDLDADAPLSPGEKLAYDAETHDAATRGLPAPTVAEFRARHPEKAKAAAKEREAIGYQFSEIDAAEAAIKSAIEGVVIARDGWNLAARRATGPAVILFDQADGIRSTPEQVQAAIRFLNG